MKAANLLKLSKFETLNVPKFIIIESDKDLDKIDNLSDGILYSVRSSCEAEDSLDKSFAGQFETYLNINKSSLKEKALEVFKSFGNYKGRVIIQEMIQADYSGVIFTSNPIGILNETVIVIGSGLGNNIVEDKIETTTYYYNTDDRLYYYEGEKLINENLLMKLMERANAIKILFGIPMDIEFAIEEGVIYILQARPITTLKETTNRIILDNSNIIESYPGISLHLTQDFVEEIYYKVFKSLIKRLVKNNKFVDTMDKDLQHMVRVCNNRVYYDITNWYKVLNLLPCSKRIISIWQDMLGVNNRDVSTLDKVNIGIKIKVVNSFINLLITCPKKMKALNESFDSLYEEYRLKLEEISSVTDLLGAYDMIMTELTDVWDITLVNDMYTFLFTAISGRIGKEKISGIKNIESMKPVDELNTLVKIYTIQKESKFFCDKVNEYIEKYGDRCLEEIKLETKTYRTNPEILLDYIRNAEVDNKSIEHKHKEEKKDNFFVKRAKVGVYNRETSRMNRSRIFGLARDIMLKIGEQLKSLGYIEDKTDVFYLHLDELKNTEYNKYRDIIDIRKQDINNSKHVPSYSRLEFIDRVINKDIRATWEKENRHELYGVASSTGKIVGEVVVIDKVNIGINTKDKIIVTESTDPGWVFLIQNCSGIIAERGSMLSHTAIITRELGKPSVVNVKGAMQLLKTGDIVELDGYTGKIRKVNS